MVRVMSLHQLMQTKVARDFFHNEEVARDFFHNMEVNLTDHVMSLHQST